MIKKISFNVTQSLHSLLSIEVEICAVHNFDAVEKNKCHIYVASTLDGILIYLWI